MLQYRRDRLLVQRVRQLLHAHLTKPPPPSGWPPAERIAAHPAPAVARRRRLAAATQDEARRDRAIELLNAATAPQSSSPRRLASRTKELCPRLQAMDRQLTGAFREQARAPRPAAGKATEAPPELVGKSSRAPAGRLRPRPGMTGAADSLTRSQPLSTPPSHFSISRSSSITRVCSAK